LWIELKKNIFFEKTLAFFKKIYYIYYVMPFETITFSGYAQAGCEPMELCEVHPVPYVWVYLLF